MSHSLLAPLAGCMILAWCPSAFAQNNSTQNNSTQPNSTQDNSTQANSTQANQDSRFHEIETKYIFGFTIGSGIGLEGEREFTIETIGNFGRSGGRYAATQSEIEYEFTPNQYIQVELAALVASHNIRDVPDMDNRSSLELAGGSAELRYLLLDRGPSSPLAITLALEPEFHRFDETTGAQVQSYSMATKVNMDVELLPNRLYFGSNIIYEPETTKTADGVWENESQLGLTGAIAYRVTPPLTVGIEADYYRHYDGFAFNAFTGDALYIGPTLYYQITPRSFVTSAFGTQIAGRSLGSPGPLNLNDFSRYRAKLKVAVEF